MIPKKKRIKLSKTQYIKLAERVLKRDKYTCQCCGKYTEAWPHHIIYRSQGGDDSLENLKLYCWECHRAIHDGKIKLDVLDTAQPLNRVKH